MSYQFLHHPVGKPSCVAGDTWDEKLKVYTMYAVSRKIPFAHVAKYLSCNTYEVVEACKDLEENRIVLFDKGKREIFRTPTLRHMADKKMGKLYDLVTKEFPCTHIRIDDFKIITLDDDFYSKRALYVRYNPNPLNPKKNPDWSRDSYWRGVGTNGKADSLSAEELVPIVIKCLREIVQPMEDEIIENIAVPFP